MDELMPSNPVAEAIKDVARSLAALASAMPYEGDRQTKTAVAIFIAAMSQNPSRDPKHAAELALAASKVFENEWVCQP